MSVRFAGLLGLLAISLFSNGALAEAISDTFTLTPNRLAGSSLDGQNTESPVTGVMWSAYDDQQGNAFTFAGSPSNGYVTPPDSLANDNSDPLRASAEVPVSYIKTMGQSYAGSYYVQANLYEPANGLTANAIGVLFHYGTTLNGYSPFLALEVQPNGSWSLVEGTGSGNSTGNTLASGTVSNTGWSSSAPLVQLTSSYSGYTDSTATGTIGGVTVFSNKDTSYFTPGGLTPFLFTQTGVDQYLDAGTNNEGFIDNFSTGAVAVPEPATIGVFTGILVAFVRPRSRVLR